MNRLWHREALRSLDYWTFRGGTPEDDEDKAANEETDEDGNAKGEDQDTVRSIYLTYLKPTFGAKYVLAHLCSFKTVPCHLNFTVSG